MRLAVENRTVTLLLATVAPSECGLVDELR